MEASKKLNWHDGVSWKSSYLRGGGTFAPIILSRKASCNQLDRFYVWKEMVWDINLNFVWFDADIKRISSSNASFTKEAGSGCQSRNWRLFYYTKHKGGKPPLYGNWGMGRFNSDNFRQFMLLLVSVVGVTSVYIKCGTTKRNKIKKLDRKTD